MSKIRISSKLLEELVFGFTDFPVDILDASFDGKSGDLVFDIAGPDVPKAEEISATLRETRNRRGDRLVSGEFVVLKP